MPNAHHPYTDHLTFAGRPIPLKRPMAVYAANRLQAILPQIAALNAAGKSQADAAAGAFAAPLATAEKLRHFACGMSPSAMSTHWLPTNTMSAVKAPLMKP